MRFGNNSGLDVNKNDAKWVFNTLFPLTFDVFWCILMYFDVFWCISPLLVQQWSFATFSRDSKPRIPVQKVYFFDVNETQLDFGKLMLRLIEINEDRDGLVQSLYGRSMKSLGDGPGGSRLLSASNMMDFLDLPVDPNMQSLMSERLGCEDSNLNLSESELSKLSELYKDVFECISQPSGWPVAWPCFGQRETLPKRRLATMSLTKSQRRLGGNRNEAFHINEAGWLVSDTSYLELRSSLQLLEIEFQLLNLRDLPKVADQRIVFISNIDGSPQFLAEDILGEWRRQASGTLLLSTRQVEWLP